jgi:ATP-dependent helicase HrpB
MARRGESPRSASGRANASAIYLTVTLAPLPVDAHIGDVRDQLTRRRAVIVSAAPGAGKTTRIPPALIDRGPVILLQPRRVAARAVARRIAEERGWAIGREIGWQIRFERRFSADTRLLVVTEGILTARLQHDPLLSDFVTVVFDEFHERSIHADLGLALARQAWLARNDLHVVVMSATLDTARVAAFLGGCGILQVAGTLHPNVIEYAGGETLSQGVAAVLPRTGGQILCFLPGAREIERAQVELAPLAVQSRSEIVPLHGSLQSEAQDEALRPTDRRRLILATNVAETSLTVPGVTGVVDTGFHKVARYDGARGIDSLTLERVPQDAADQRAGRAARLGPGLVRRLWDSHQRLQPHGDAELMRVDLAGPILDLLAWGADLTRFEWFEPPPADRIELALRLLVRLGAVENGALTSLGRQMQRIPAHPRIARILIDGGGAPEVAVLAAQLGGEPRAVEQLRRATTDAVGAAARSTVDDAELRHALFRGYADRLAKRRAGGSDRFLLASGHGAVLARECEPITAELLVALEVVAAERDGVAQAQIRRASAVNRDWVRPLSTAVEHWFDAEAGRVRAARIERYDAVVLTEHPVRPDADAAAALLANAWLERGGDQAATQLRHRARFAGRDLDLPALARAAALTATSLDDIDVTGQLPYDLRRTLDSAAPTELALPSGRSARLDYSEDGTVTASVKLQELFGLAESPALGPNRVPVTFYLLAPNGRPVQTTRDLRSFWARTYPEVRKELRGRYPKHPWPEDPWTATATHRTVRPR